MNIVRVVSSLANNKKGNSELITEHQNNNP